MDEDLKKTLFFGAFSLLSSAGLYYFNTKLHDLNEKRQMLADQGVCYTPSTLEQKRQLFRDSAGPRFAVVNGVCLTRKHAENAVDKVPSGSKKLYKIDYEVELTTSVAIPQLIGSQDKEQEFVLVDPMSPKTSQMAVVPGNDAVGYNIARKRKFYKSVYDYNRRDSRNYDKLSLIAYEGSALSLLGMVEYIPQTDSFKMTKVAGFISGGLRESLKFFDRQITEIRALWHLTAYLTGIFATITGFVLYSRYQKWRTELRMEQQRLEEEARFLSLKRMPSSQADQAGVICAICLGNPSNVISIPCNHLSMCIGCFNQMKSRYLNGQDRNFECPCCRIEMNTEEYILVEYKPGEQ
ncbi:hypothetical protein FGO68_gene10271 [Halteria grandinella]|uniref:RING-type domain-containing protein n=1 Tax=Halteria grandinella TaxID=5974 RepID=A0A8J8T4V4_HALGN|nr:hypothetical protein FGO68_gene10271 [Halteria grandinella]